MEGYRQDWELSFEKDTVNRGGWYVAYLAEMLYTRVWRSRGLTSSMLQLVKIYIM